MTQPEAAVVAATIGGLTALIGAIIAGAVALRNETRRRVATRRDVENQAVRTQAAEVFRHMFSLQHEMEWITWHAAHRPKSVDLEMAKKYEEAVHVSYPKLLGEMAVLASLDVDIYHRLGILVEQMYDFEGQLGEILTGLNGWQSRAVSVSRMAALFQPVKEMYIDFPPAMAEVMSYARSGGATGRWKR